MTKARFALTASAIIVLAGSALTAETTNWNWSDGVNSNPDFARSKAVCASLGEPIIPVADRPSAQDVAHLKGCDSEALYYGENGPPDYVKARHCAIIEAQAGIDDVFAGNAILMMLYANGRGVPRNIPLATALACDMVSAAPAESNGRVIHLQSLAAKPEIIDVCEDGTSGYIQGMCAQHDAINIDIDRNRKIAAVLHQFPAAAMTPYSEIKTRFESFVTAHANDEIDLSGSRRDANIIEADADERDQFLKDITRLANGQWLPASPADAAAADAALNQSYRDSLKACVERSDNFSTVRANDVRATQRLWLAYRDAYLRFAQVAAPTVPQSAILARLTKLRTAELDSLPCK